MVAGVESRWKIWFKWKHYGPGSVQALVIIINEHICNSVINEHICNSVINEHICNSVIINEHIRISVIINEHIRNSVQPWTLYLTYLASFTQPFSL